MLSREQKSPSWKSQDVKNELLKEFYYLNFIKTPHLYVKQFDAFHSSQAIYKMFLNDVFSRIQAVVIIILLPFRSDLSASAVFMSAHLNYVFLVVHAEQLLCLRIQSKTLLHMSWFLPSFFFFFSCKFSCFWKDSLDILSGAVTSEADVAANSHNWLQPQRIYWHSWAWSALSLSNYVLKSCTAVRQAARALKELITKKSRSCAWEDKYFIVQMGWGEQCFCWLMWLVFLVKFHHSCKTGLF